MNSTLDLDFLSRRVEKLGLVGARILYERYMNEIYPRHDQYPHRATFYVRVEEEIGKSRIVFNTRSSFSVPFIEYPKVGDPCTVLLDISMYGTAIYGGTTIDEYRFDIYGLLRVRSKKNDWALAFFSYPHPVELENELQDSIVHLNTFAGVALEQKKWVDICRRFLNEVRSEEMELWKLP